VTQARNPLKNKTRKWHASVLHGFASAARLPKNPHPKWSKPMRAPSEITFTPFLPHQKEALIVQRLFKLYTFKLILNPTDWIIELDAPRIKYQTC
jgi:hypothetical protein